MKTTGVLVVILIGAVQSYRHYQDVIPNGAIVPHPCKPNYVWWGVGHKNPLGGGARNPFGVDFEKIHQWTPELCNMDSDGDGKTNGEELGDPGCTWTPGTTPSRISGITHPGICDPWGDAKCAESNKDVTCATGEFICDGLDSSDVFNITLRFPPTLVPAKETTYMCYTFELDMLEPGEEYHLIASKPFIDNANVMHHTTLTGCGPTSEAMTEPAECNMASNGCQESLAVWTLGMPGDCVYKEAGFKIGRSGFTRLSMQHHWTNPQLIDDYVDSSGMILYLTKKLRKYNAAYFITGDIHLDIPPGRDRVVETSTCSSECTRKIIEKPVYLMTGWNHMHYLGYQQNVEHYRGGVKIGDLTPDTIYSYDNPVVHEYNPLVEFRPGDRLETTCVYRSHSKRKTTYYGLGSYDEMCFGIFTFFPAENIKTDSCTTFDEFEFCLFENSTNYGCNYEMLINATHPERQALFSTVLDNCNVYGGCRTECPAAIEEVKKHPCFTGAAGKYTMYALAASRDSIENVKFVAGMTSCSKNDDKGDWAWPNSAEREASTVSKVISLFVVFITYLTH